MSLSAELKERIEAAVLALDNDYEPPDRPVEGWLKTLRDWRDQKHSGDCTKQPWTCVRCQAEAAVKKAVWLITALEPFLAAQGQEWREDDRYELQRKSVQSAVNTARRALRDDYGQMPGHSTAEIQVGCLSDVIFGAEHWLASFPPQAEGEG